MIGRGVGYRKTDETDLLRSKRGSCSSGGVWHTAKRTKPTCVGAVRSKQGGGVWRTAKRDFTGCCSSPPSTSSSLHGLPSTSSDLHGLLLIQPPPRATPLATVQPPLHEVVCSSSPPRGPVHPAPTGSNDRGPIHPPPPGTVHPNPPATLTVHPEATPRGPVHPPPPGTVHPTPLQRSLFIQRQHRSASVSSSSEGIARSGSINSHRSFARVQ